MLHSERWGGGFVAVVCRIPALQQLLVGGGGGAAEGPEHKLSRCCASVPLSGQELRPKHHAV